MSENQCSVNQYAMIQLEILKELTIDGKVMPQVKFELNLPYGLPWAEAETACDDFKITLQNMKARQEEALAAQAAAQPEVQVVPAEPEVITPEVL